MSLRLSRAYPSTPPPSWLSGAPIGPRLAALAAWVPPGRALVDVGTDHARLPEALLAAGRVPSVIAIDRAETPLAKAAHRLSTRSPELRAHLQLRRGEGLEPLQPGEAEVLSAAGMGGRMIAKILKDGDPRGLGILQLILQPERDDPALRVALGALGYGIEEERLVVDGRRCFIILRAHAEAPPHCLSPGARFFGPEQAPGPVYEEWIGARLRLLRARLQGAGDLAPELEAAIAEGEARLDRCKLSCQVGLRTWR